FLSVAVIHWGIMPHLSRPEHDGVQQLLEANRPVWLKALRWLGRSVLEAYIITLVIWLAVTPLAASRYNMLAPARLILGPPLTLLTSIALLAGFLFLLVAIIAPVRGTPFVPIIHGCLALCARLVDIADSWRFGSIYIGEVSTWWLWIYYIAMLLMLA